MQDGDAPTLLVDTVSGKTFYLVRNHTRLDPRGPEIYAWVVMPKFAPSSKAAVEPATSRNN